MDEIVVTAGRTSESLSRTNKNIQIITADELMSAPANSIQDLLQYVAGVDIKQRGTEGVQADISINGGTFEQTLVMVDGIKVNDAQTAHHNFNLPVPLEQIERIEIVKGEASSFFGSNAISGVVNIITKKMKDGKAFELNLLGGEYGFYSTGLFGGYGYKNFDSQISFAKTKSDGYRSNTNFDEQNVYFRSMYQFDANQIHFAFGYNDKKFGANNFYSDKYPNQWEHTTTKLTALTGELHFGNVSITPKLYWRRNDDTYLLNYLIPSFYQNIHQTNSYTFEVQNSLNSSLGVSTIGGEVSRDVLKSTNLGSHSRQKSGIFGEQRMNFDNFNFSLGLFAYNYEKLGWRIWPGGSIGYRITHNARAFASIGRAFRTPSFTELYYNYFVIPKKDTQKGNPDLKYEESTNYEVGFQYLTENITTTANIFIRDGKNNIDWGRVKTDSIWYSYNIVSSSTIGINLNAEILHPFSPLPFIKKLTLGYAYLNVTASLNRENFESRYVFDHLKNQCIAGITYDWWFSLQQNWIVRYEERISGDKNFLVDTQLNAQFAQQEVYLTIENLLNSSYKDFSGIPLPGRWVFAGVRAKII